MIDNLELEILSEEERAKIFGILDNFKNLRNVVMDSNPADYFDQIASVSARLEKYARYSEILAQEVNNRDTTNIEVPRQCLKQLMYMLRK